MSIDLREYHRVIHVFEEMIKMTLALAKLSNFEKHASEVINFVIYADFPPQACREGKKYPCRTSEYLDTSQFPYKFGVPKADMTCHGKFVKRTKKTHSRLGLGGEIIENYWLN